MEDQAKDGVTFFSIPKAFHGHTGIIQSNAIGSWTQLPGSEVILFGEEAGGSEVVRSGGVRFEPGIARNAQGTPLVSDAFAKARTLARHPNLAFVNADIVLRPDLLEAVRVLSQARFPSWMMVGQRCDLDVRERLRFEVHWEQALADEVRARGVLHGKSGIDFFVFPRCLPIELPPLAVGRVGWDNWLIFAVRQARIPLVDATQAVCAVHQNHPPTHDPVGTEADHNRASAGGYYRMGSLRDADWQLIRDRSGQWTVVPRLMGKLWFSPPFRAGSGLKRALSRRLTGSRF